MLLDPNATAYDNANQPDYFYEFTYPYSNFAYKIPVNADNSPTTQNIVVNNEIGIDIPAGTYDFFIVQPFAIANAIAGLAHQPGDYDRGNNFVFEANKIYEFEVILVNYVEQVILTITDNTPATAHVILMAGDLYGDGTGYQMLLDPNATAYDNANQPDYTYPFTYPYSNFAYKIPVNADDSPTTQNIVVNDTIGIDIPAGTYDFFIVNPYPGAGAIAGLYHQYAINDRGNDFVFEADKIYKFEVVLYKPDPNDQYFITQKVNLTITDNSPVVVPAVPTGFTVTPGAGGALSAALSWTNPDVDADGNALSSITSITIKRDGTVIDTYTSELTPGAAATYTDNTPTVGDHAYSIYASNAGGDGAAVNFNVYVGATPQNGTARVILKAGDLYNDGTGYQMLLDPNATAYNNANQLETPYPFTYPYSNFAYKIPVNADDSPTTQNIVVNDSIGIDIPAGTYDFFIVNPYPGAGAIAGLYHQYAINDRGNNFVFEANKIYEFEVILYEAAPLYFTQKVNLTVTDPCSVQSAATYTQGFEENDATLGCIKMYNQGSGESWSFNHNEPQYVHSGTGSSVHKWASRKTYPKAWMVLPKIDLDAAYVLDFWSYIRYAGDYETGQASVWISTGSGDPDDGGFTKIWEADKNNANEVAKSPDAWREIKISLEAYAGQQVYIAFLYGINNNEYGDFAWYIDDVKFNPAGVPDVEVTGLIRPVNGQLTDAEQVTVKVKNFGTSEIADVPVKLVIDGGVPAESTIPNIASGAEVEFTFPGTFDFSVVKTYQITVYTDLTGDGDRSNDTISVSVTNIGNCVVSAFPYTEGFENDIDILCWSKYGTSNWAITASAHDGSRAILSGSQDSWLVSPKISIPATGVYGLSFWSYNVSSGYYQKNSVMISKGSKNPDDNEFTEVWSPTSVAGEWVETKIDLAAYAGEDIYIAFRYIGSSHIWILDDVAVKALPIDAGVTEIKAPLDGGQADAQVKVSITNSGEGVLISVPVAYKLNGGNEVAETYTGSLIAGDTIEYTFTQTVDLSQYGDYTLEVYTKLAGDINPNNDGKTVTIEYKDTSAPVLNGINISEGANDIAVNLPIILTFNKNITSSKLGDITLTGGSGAVTVTPVIADSVLTVNHADLANMTTYTLTVPAGTIDNYDTVITLTYTTLGTNIGNVKVSAKVYPTLTRGNITVETGTKATVKVVDIFGKVLAVYQSEGVLPVELNYANGTYFILVENIASKVILAK